MKVLFTLFFATPEKAARPVVYLSCAPEVECDTGVYLHMRTPKQLDERAAAPDFANALFSTTRDLLQKAAQP